MFNILYMGRKIYTNLTFEQASIILEELLHDDNYDKNEIELEELNG